MDIPVPIRILYGDFKSISAQMLSEYKMYLPNQEYYEGIGAGAPGIFPPEAPFIVLTDNYVRKNPDLLFALHHEIAHIKDFRYSGENSIVSIQSGLMEAEKGKKLGFKTAVENGLISGWPPGVVHDYDERIVDWCADTRPTIEIVKKSMNAHHESEVTNCARLAIKWKRERNAPKTVRDYMMHILAMDLGKETAHGVSRKQRIRAQYQLKGYEKIVEGSKSFFESMKRPTSIDILKTELKRLDDIVGLVEASK